MTETIITLTAISFIAVLISLIPSLVMKDFSNFGWDLRYFFLLNVVVFLFLKIMEME